MLRAARVRRAACSVRCAASCQLQPVGALALVSVPQQLAQERGAELVPLDLSLNPHLTAIMTGQYEPPITLDQVLDRASIGLPLSAPHPPPIGGAQSPGGGDQGAADGNGQADIDPQGLPAGRAGAENCPSGNIAVVNIPGGAPDSGLAESWAQEADRIQASVGVVLDHVVQPVCIRAAARPPPQDPTAISVHVDDGRDASGPGRLGRAEPAPAASPTVGGEATHLRAGEGGGGGAYANEQLQSAEGSRVKITTFIIT